MNRGIDPQATPGVPGGPHQPNRSATAEKKALERARRRNTGTSHRADDDGRSFIERIYRPPGGPGRRSRADSTLVRSESTDETFHGSDQLGRVEADSVLEYVDRI